MSYRDRSRKQPHMPRIIKLEVDEKNIKGRFIGVAVLLAIAFTALFVGLKGAFTTEPGWKVMKSYAEGVSYSEDFVFNYYLGAEGVNATTEQRAINQVYAKAMEDAYRIFTNQVLADGTHNIGYLNAHLNEEVEVEPALYRAFEILEQAGLRYIYLAPVYVEYNGVFLATSDGDAALSDPMRSEEQAEYVRMAAAYAADPAMVSLELLGGNNVILRVSEEYQIFLDTYEIDAVLDLNWMTNAFVADFVADTLIQAGFDNGYLASFDGFTRNLGGVDEIFRFNLFNREGQTYYLPAMMDYSGAMSLVYLRDYPMDNADRWHYYSYEDGGITSIFLDPADGMSKAAVTDLVVYGEAQSCAELLTLAAPAVIADAFDASALLTAADQGVGAIWSESRTMYHTQADAAITMAEDPGYGLELAK